MWLVLNVFNASGYPAHNFEILRDECVEKAQRNFQANKMKVPKITVNERLMGYYGFGESSASALILLDVSNTDIQLPKMNFSFTNLIMLHSSNNGLKKIDEIGNETFPSLKFLNLSRNAITSIASHVFSHLSEVEVLDLSYNCFVNFNYDHALMRHEHLKKIYLHDNILHSVYGTPGLSHILNLDLLDLRRNFIEKFDNFNLEVKNLYLKNNLLKSLTIHNAKSMTLDASENSLNAFISTGSFLHLNLSKNEFKFLTQVEIREAKKIILAYNAIESLDTDESSEQDSSEMDSIRIENLDISYNRLSTMKDLKFFKYCEFINLEGNQMKNLDFEKIRRDFPHVNRINLIQNPLSEIDVNEATFHNDTRFLKIQFDYVAQEVALEPTLIPPIQLLFPTLTTNFMETTTLSQIIKIKESNFDNEKEELIEKAEFLLFFYLLIFLLLIASVLAVIYSIYKKQSSARLRVMNSKFNEAENPL